MLVLPDSAPRQIKGDFAGGSNSDRLEMLPKDAFLIKLFLSDGDILNAWAARLCCGILLGADRPVMVMGVYEARSRLPEVFPKCGDKPGRRARYARLLLDRRPYHDFGSQPFSNLSA